jgi:16S rRNA (guanine1207-N2)-methyltransferase
MGVAADAHVIDLGCGYGVIGIVAARLAPDGHVTLIDTDIHATRLAEQNLALNGATNATVILADAARDLPPDARYDIIATNPLTHSGREVLNDFVTTAHAVLHPAGASTS